MRSGTLDSENIAKLLMGWVNGDKVKDIAHNIKCDGQSDEAVIVSKLGVPRFAVDNVLSVLKKAKPNLSISIENMSEVKGAIKEIAANEYRIENARGLFIKEFVDQRLAL